MNNSCSAGKYIFACLMMLCINLIHTLKASQAQRIHEQEQKSLANYSTYPIGLINSNCFCYYNAEIQLAYAALVAKPSLYKQLPLEAENFFTIYKACAKKRVKVRASSIEKARESIGTFLEQFKKSFESGPGLLHKTDWQSVDQEIGFQEGRYQFIHKTIDWQKIDQEIIYKKYRYQLIGILSSICKTNPKRYPQFARYTHNVAYINLNGAWFHCSDEQVDPFDNYNNALQHLADAGEIDRYQLLYAQVA